MSLPLRDEPVPVYRPRPPTNQLKEIIDDSLEELYRVWDEKFQETFGPLPARVRELCERFLRCGDLHFGFLRLRCVTEECPDKRELLLPYSCRARGLCPTRPPRLSRGRAGTRCQRRALEWAERMVEEVLPLVPYRHLIFTIPVTLRKAFLFDRSLYGDLCRVAYSSTRDFLRSKAPLLARQGKAVPAMIVSPQSFGDLLISHAHAHAICSLGLFRKDGIFFPMEDLDFSGLEELFRERFFEMMLKREKILPQTVEKFKTWDHSGFSVGWDRKFETDDRKGLEGLLSYIERAPVSIRRLNYRPDGMVHYQGTQVHPRLGIDHQLLTPVEFLANLIPHVILKYEVTLRLYGALSTTFRRRIGWTRNPPVRTPPPESIPAPEIFPHPDLGTTPEFPKPESFTPSTIPTSSSQHPEADDDPDWLRKRKRSWATLIYKAWCVDPRLCQSCGKPMKIIAAIAPEQADVIERVLRHLHLWDPPWKRQRKARGPPPSSSSGSAATSTPAPEETSDRIIDDELYAVDPIPQDDDETRA